ncbi:hypothetical protein ABS735_04035 [Streptomyces sp. MMCC 100]
MSQSCASNSSLLLTRKPKAVTAKVMPSGLKANDTPSAVCP